MKKKKRNDPEYQLQCAYFDWINIMLNSDKRYGYVYSTLNGIRLPIGLAVKAKKSGLRKGIWDVPISYPNFKTNKCGAFIEFKAGKNELTKEQIEFRDNNPYYKFVVFYDLESAIMFTEQWFSKLGDI